MDERKWHRMLLWLLMAVCATLGQAQENRSQWALREILRAFSQKTGTRLIYSDDLIDGVMADAALAEIGTDSLIAIVLERNGIQWRKTANGPMILYSLNERNLTGMIIDKERNAVVPHANIRLKGSRSGTTSDENGFFRIQVQPAHLCTLLVAHIGYFSYELPIVLQDRSRNVLIPLQERQLPMPGITITANQEKGVIVRRDGDFVLEPEAIGALPGESPKDILRAVQLLPGMTSFDTGLSLRGNWPGQNITVINGLPILTPYHLFGFLSAIDPYIIDEVKVFRNRRRYEYPDYSGGVLSLSSLSQNNPRRRFVAGINRLYSHAMLQLPFGSENALLLSFRDSHLQQSDSLYSDIFQYQTGYELNKKWETAGTSVQFHSIFMDGAAILKLRAHARHRLEGLLFWNHSLFRQSITMQDERMDTGRLQDKTWWSGLTWGLKWRQDWNPHWFSTLTFYRSARRQDYFYTYLSDLSLESRTDFIDRSLRWDHTLKPAKRHFLNMGIGWSGKDLSKNATPQLFSQEMVYTLPARAQLLWGYWQHIFQLTPAMRLETGLRETFYRYDEKAPGRERYRRACPEPSLRWVYDIDAAWHADFEIHQSCQFTYAIDLPPSQRELRITDPFYLSLPQWQLANQHHQPVRSRQVQLNLGYASGSYSCNMSLYAQKARNYDRGTFIDWGTTAVDSYLRIHDSVQSGIGAEWMLEKRHPSGTTWLGYSVGRVRERGNLAGYEAGAAPLTSSPSIWNSFAAEHASPLDLRHVLTLGARMAQKGWQVAALWQYRSGRPYNKPNGYYLLKDHEQQAHYYFDFTDVNHGRLPDYHTLNVSASRTFCTTSSKRSLELGISAANLYSHKNVLYRSYYLDNTAQNAPVLMMKERIAPRFNLNLYLVITL